MSGRPETAGTPPVRARTGRGRAPSRRSRRPGRCRPSRPAVPLREAVQQDETVDTGLVGVIASMALVPDLSGPGPVAYQRFPDTRTFRVKTEEVLHEIAGGAGGVILGRAAALVLADTPGALHVRLDGPVQARVEAIVRRTGQDRA